MGTAPYGDVTIFYHGIFALLVPFGWALILYPYWRLHRQQWYKTLIFVAVLSFSFMVAKEIYLDKEISSDDIAADLLGLFFGTGLASLLLYLEGKIARSWTKRVDHTVTPCERDKDEPNRGESFASPREISLRDILGVLARIHERGGALYEHTAKNSPDRDTKELSTQLAGEKRGHARAVACLLTRWPQKVPDVNVLDWMDKGIGRYGIFASPIPPDTTDRELLDYAVGQERKIHELFSTLHDHFQGYSWRTIQYENTILELKAHGKRLQERYLKRVENDKGDSPAPAKSPVKRTAAPDGRSPEGRDAAVLVVDDEEAVRTAVAEYLKDDGYLQVDTARDGQEAMDRFESGRYDVIVVDIAMPKRHGIDVLRQIKSRAPETQVIIITGRAGKDSAIAALKLGAFDYIEKPFDFAVLAKSVANAIKKKRLSEKGE
ncbi:MAG: response regulator [Deltaproteobacteria bacterium]|nr:response regulator [Candidatus Zymogenaceae bacterium]